jgi:hypothetical protein
MNRYRFVQRLVAGFLGLMLLAGVGGQFFNERHELFPFYSWFLFSLVPQPDAAVYELLIHEAPAGRVFDPPIASRKADEGLIRSSHSVDLFRNVQELGRAAQARDAALCDRLRAGIERRFRVAGLVRYEIVKQTFDNAIARWASRDAAPHRQESVATFLRGAPTTFSSPPPAPASSSSPSSPPPEAAATADPGASPSP